jgi:hypothetical protein
MCGMGYTHYIVKSPPLYPAPTRVIHLAASAADADVPGISQDPAGDGISLFSNSPRSLDHFEGTMRHMGIE